MSEATKQDLLEMKDQIADQILSVVRGLHAETGQRLDTIDKRLDAMDQRFLETEHPLVEAMRDMQTELLRGFEAFSVSQTIRLKKVEADRANLDLALSGRVGGPGEAPSPNRITPDRPLLRRVR